MFPFAPYPLLHAGASIRLTSFTVHWSTVFGLLALAGLYEWRARAAGGVGADVRSPMSDVRRWYFYAGLLAIFFSLRSLAVVRFISTKRTVSMIC